MSPRVSVIVRSMDAPTLERALQSIAAQDQVSTEVVLVAACGPSHRPVDGSRYPFQLTFVESAEPLTRPRAANAGLDAAHGDLITFLDHDDEFLPGHLAGLVSVLDGQSPYGVAYCRFQVYEAGKLFVTVGHAFDRFELYEKSYIHHSAMLFRKELLAHGVRYDTALDIHDDWDFVLQLSERTRFRFVDQTTFRWHSDIGTSGGGGVGNFDPVKYGTQRDYVRNKWAGVCAGRIALYNENVEKGMAALQRGALDEAERFLAAAREDTETDADLLNALAMLSYRRGDYATASEQIDSAIGVRDRDARLWFNRGLACAAGGRSADASASFKRTLELQPEHAGAKAWLARLTA